MGKRDKGVKEVKFNHPVIRNSIHLSFANSKIPSFSHSKFIHPLIKIIAKMLGAYQN